MTGIHQLDNSTPSQQWLLSLLAQWLEYSVYNRGVASSSLTISKLTDVTKLADIVTLAMAVFETSISKALNNGEIDERELDNLQELHLKVVNELVNINRKMELETRTQLQKSLLEEIIEIKKTLRTRDAL